MASSASVIVFKQLGVLQTKFDRPELRDLVEHTREALAGVAGDKRRWGFGYSPDADFLGLVQNELPSFWKVRLSRLLGSAAAPSVASPAKKMTLEEKIRKALERRAQGASLKEIADELGVSWGTIINYLRRYPYRRK